MKKLNLSIFILIFGFIAVLLFSVPMKQFDYMTSYKMNSEEDEGEGNKAELAQAQAEERSFLLRNVTTGKVEPNDWYTALRQIVSLSERVNTRSGELEWQQQGPDQVGGRTRGFVFDKLNPGRCYTGSVSGGLFVSDDLGEKWRIVDSMADSLRLMSIGCMTQSKEGDIYAGTGEYWGNTPNGSFGSQFYGNGIYKKDANSEIWSILPSTITSSLTNAVNNGNFQQVIDIACDPEDNDIVYAGTSKGLFKSIDAGATWTKLSTVGGAAGQIKIAVNGDLYAAIGGSLFKSIDKGSVFTSIAPVKFRADRNGHIRIALSKTDPDKIYACGIDNASDLKYVILSKDAGVTWNLLGEGDAFLNPLCSEIENQRQCQGWYDMCLAVHPKDDNIIFLGGMSRLYSWSERYGWVQSSYGYSPAILGINELHADMHEIAFHSNSDTMVVVCDGGVYMSKNSFKNFPDKIVWKPKNNKYNVTQFYDMAVSKYGELIGGAQDNGTQFVSLKGSSSTLSFEVGAGDGFDVAISGARDYQVAFGTVYYGTIRRTINLSSTNQPVSTGHCADLITRGTGDAKPDGKIDNVDFHTRTYLAEEIEARGDDETDTVLNSFFFAFNSINGIHISPNATNDKSSTVFTQAQNAGVGVPLIGHHSKDLNSIYIGGSSGLRRLNNLPSVIWDSFSVQLQPCIRPKTPLSFSNTTGISGSIGGVYVDQNDATHVVATQIGFGGTSKVFESRGNNGLSFVSKQGNLPVMPTYTCVIDPDDDKHVIVGTEFGIWETMDISAASPSWEEQNKLIGRVPVFKLKLLKLRKEGCNVLYAGTHGRGFFRVPFPIEKSGCDYSLKPRNVGNNVGVNTAINIGVSFNIYPNPSTDNVNIAFSAKNSKVYTINIYDMNGRLVKKSPYKSFVGNNIVQSDISHLKDGNYIIRLEDDKSVIGGKILTKN